MAASTDTKFADQMKVIVNPGSDELSESEKKQFATDISNTIFADGDTNADGLLSKDEISAYINETCKKGEKWDAFEEDMKDVMTDFKDCDSDSDGKISKAELIDFLVKWSLSTDFTEQLKALATTKLEDDQKKQFAKDISSTIFKAGDSDKDGFLSKVEIKTYINDTCKKGSAWDAYEEDMKDVFSDFAECDSNNDGKISQDELIGFLVKWQL